MSVSIPRLKTGVRRVSFHSDDNERFRIQNASVTVADFQITGTSLHAQSSHGNTSSSAAAELASIASFLLRSGLQPSSIPTYQRAWKLFHQFFVSTFHHPFRALPISPSILALFIAYLFRSQYAPSTVMTYVSCLGYCHKLKGFSDPSNA